MIRISDAVSDSGPEMFTDAHCDFHGPPRHTAMMTVLVCVLVTNQLYVSERERVHLAYTWPEVASTWLVGGDAAAKYDKRRRKSQAQVSHVRYHLQATLSKYSVLP